MKAIKKSITILILILLGAIGYAFYLLYSEVDTRISNLLTLTYVFVAFITVLIYRISLIQQQKINIILTALAIITLALASLFYFKGDTLEFLWNYALVGFITLSGLTLNQLINRQNKLSSATKILILLSTLFINLICIFELRNPAYFYILGFFAILSSMFVVLNLFVAPKNS